MADGTAPNATSTQCALKIRDIMNFPTRIVARPSRWTSACALLVAATVFSFAGLAAQEIPAVDARRPVATRAELQHTLEEAEALANSDAYSASFREDKRQEAALIRERLLEGDFYVGDQILITVTGDSGSSGTRVVGPGRVVTLPGLPDIPVRGVLRSEIEPYLIEQVSRFVRDPQIKARPLIRLTFMGAVGKPGFYQMDADKMLSDALMDAGGIGNGTELKKSKITRGEEVILDGDAFDKAVTDGVNLDQLNLRAGDVIDVGQKKNKDWFTTLRTFAVIPALILSSYGIGKLFGIF
jgi:protein involved in polysaccharide export with SLBB domain